MKHDNGSSAQLSRALAELRAILEATGEGIVVLDSAGRIAHLNDRFMRMWSNSGLSRGVSTITELVDCVKGQLENAEEFEATLLEQHDVSQPAPRALRLRDERVVELKSLPLMIGDEPSGRVLSFRDVTERERLHRLIGQLEKKQGVEQLARGLAHNFNNIFFTISSICENILLDMGEEHPISRDISAISEETDRAVSLTRHLLAFSRRQLLSLEVMNLNDFVTDVSRIVRRVLGEGVKVELVLGPAPTWVRADRRQLEQLILNLAANARDAMPEGGRLTIETTLVELDERYARRHPETAAGRYVLLAVTDTGRGMDEGILARVFEPFFTSKRRGKGVGLGLPTVYGIARQHGGHVQVDSAPNQGTTCKVYLPRIK